MKLFKGLIISAGLVMAAGAANAQAVSPYEAGRSAAVPGYGPRLLPSQEVYTVLRDTGFSPLGIPRLRGYVYTIAVVDRRGGDGRLMIDARDGRIVRFVPGGRMGDNFDGALATSDGPPGPVMDLRSEPRPQRAVPKVASRTVVPVPKPRAGEAQLPAAQPLAAQPAPEPPAQQSAAAPAKPAEPRTVGQTAAAPAAAVPAAPAPVEAKPAPQILPTQDMPNAQGL